MDKNKNKSILSVYQEIVHSDGHKHLCKGGYQFKIHLFIGCSGVSKLKAQEYWSGEPILSPAGLPDP